MKRIILTAIICCLLTLGTGCMASWEDSPVDKLATDSVLVTLAEDAPTPTRDEPVLKLQYQNLTMEQYYLGMQPQLEYLSHDGTWLVVPLQEEADQENMAYILNAANFVDETVDLRDYYSQLKKGEYRYIKSVSNGKEIIYTGYTFTLE